MAKMVGHGGGNGSVDFPQDSCSFPGNKMRVATPMPQGSDRLRRRPTGAG